MVFKILNYIEPLLIFVSTVIEYVPISAFASLVGIPVGIASFALGIKMFAKTAVIKKYNSIINKEKKKHDKIALLAKIKLNSGEILISKALVNSISVNNILKEYDDMKEKFKNPNSKYICLMW